MLHRRAWFYYAISALGLPLYLWAFAAQSSVGSLPRGYPPERLGPPARFEGVPVESAAEIAFLAEGSPPGTTVEVVAADGRAARAALVPWAAPAQRGITLASGLLFWSIAAFVFAVRSAAGPVRSFFWCTFLYGLAIMVGGVHFPGAPPWRAAAGALLQFACLASLPPLFLHMTLTFPQRRAFLDRRPWVMPVLAVLAAALVAWQGSTYLAYAAHPRPAVFRSMSAAGRAAAFLLIIQVMASFILLATGIRRLELTRERAQVKWLLWGFALGVTPYVFFRTLVQLVGLTPPFGRAVDRIFEAAIPIAFVLAVVLYRLFDIDIIIRRSVIYAALAVLLTGLAAAAGLTIGKALGHAGAPAWLAPLVVGIGAGLVLVPLRRAIGWWVDRIFFQMTLGYRRSLERFRTGLDDVPSQQDLASSLDEFIAAILRPRAHSVMVRDGDGYAVAGACPVGDAADLFAEASRAWERSDLAGPTLARAHGTSLPEIETGSFPEALEGRGFVLAQGIEIAGSVDGWIFLGVRATERRYIERDVRLVRSAAAEAGRALARIRFVQQAAGEAMARRRSEEMNRLKSEFLSHVAHDLRTPVASIVWSTENLLDGVTGGVTEKQARYLRSVRASARHLDRLVTSLLEISRHERKIADVMLAPLDLAAVLEQAVETMRPIAEEKGVRFALAAAERPLVMADAGKLLEVALNLLDNAVKFSPPGGAVDVGVSVAREGRPTFTVRDRGPGLGGADRDALFERYGQAAPSPHTGRHGFGLGLYIARTFLEMMGGTIEARDHEVGGAVFICALRAACDAEREEA